MISNVVANSTIANRESLCGKLFSMAICKFDLNSLKISRLLSPSKIKKFNVFVYFIAPPLELKKKFSDGSRRFEFEWVISGQGLKIGLALKSRFTRENLRFSKSFQTGQGCLSSRGGDNKVSEHGKYLCLRIFNNPCPRQIRVRGAEFSCPRGVRGPRGRNCHLRSPSEYCIHFF